MIKVYFQLEDLQEFEQGTNIPVSTYKNSQLEPTETVEMYVPTNQFYYLAPKYAKGHGFHPSVVQGFIRKTPYAQGEKV